MAGPQQPHTVGHQALTDRTLRGAVGTIDDMLVSQQNEFRSDGQRLSSFKPILPVGTSTGFSGTGGMTFSVTTDPVTGLVTYRYLMLTQELMFVDVWLHGTIGGTVSSGVLLPLPVGFTLAGTNSRTPCQVLNGGVQGVGLFVLDPAPIPNFIKVYRDLTGANFALGDTYVIGQVLVNVTPLS